MGVVSSADAPAVGVVSPGSTFGCSKRMEVWSTMELAVWGSVGVSRLEPGVVGETSWMPLLLGVEAAGEFMLVLCAIEDTWR